jgi:hypothetical protein
MIETSDRAVDDAYRRGIAALIALRPAPSAEITRRHIPVLVAIAGIAIPLAALVIAALVVIDGHGQPSHPVRTAPAQASSPASNTAAVGHSFHITGIHGVGADVTIEKVVFASGDNTLSPPPANGLYAIADVMVSIPAGQAIQSPPPQYTDEVAVVTQLRAELPVAIANNDVARAHELELIIASYKLKLSKLALELMPFHLEYITNTGDASPAWGGSTDTAGFAPQVYSASSPDGVMTGGLTALEVVFDVSSRGGAILMTDSVGKVIGRWVIPTIEQPKTPGQ